MRSARADVASIPERCGTTIKVSLRESYPPVYDPAAAARAARAATRADAEPALVMASRDARPVRGDRPGRLGAGRPGPGPAAGRGPARAAGQPGRRPPVSAPARRRRGRTARVRRRPALVPERPGAGRGPGGGGVLLARVRDHRGAAAVLRRPGHPGR